MFQLQRDLADSDFEVDQLKVAFKCSSFARCAGAGARLYVWGVFVCSHF